MQGPTSFSIYDLVKLTDNKFYELTDDTKTHKEEMHFYMQKLHGQWKKPKPYQNINILKGNFCPVNELKSVRTAFLGNFIVQKVISISNHFYHSKISFS